MYKNDYDYDGDYDCYEDWDWALALRITRLICYVHILGCVEVEHACLYGDCWIVQVFTYVYMIHGDKRCG